jgi:hypothetical protein
MISEIFKRNFLPPENINLGFVTLYDEEKVTDVISGFEGNYGNNGWLMSERLITILKDFNVGQYKTYEVNINHRNRTYANYKYFRFINNADNYVDFSKSTFYKMKGFVRLDTREIIPIKSINDINETKEKLDKGWFLGPKEMFLKSNTLDLFKFSKLNSVHSFCSIKLAERLKKEGITGFNFQETTLVKLNK